MNGVLKTLDAYISVLQEHLAGAEEVALARAYELGRQAVVEGLGILDMLSIHHQGFIAILNRATQASLPPEEVARITKAADDIFREAVAPFEMVHRGFADANAALRKLNDTLELKVTERTQEIQRQVNRLTALRTIDLAITGSLDLRVTLNVILDQVTTQLKVDAANVLLLNPHTQTLRHATNRGFRGKALQHADLRMGEGYAGRAALERRIVSIPHLAEAPGEFSHSRAFPEEGFIAYHAVPLIAKAKVKGVLELFHRSPLDPGHEWLDFLEALSGQAAIAIDNSTLFDGLERANIDLIMAYDTTLEGWSRALDLRDKETEGHTLRVTDITLALARTMGVSELDLVHVRRGALLHDIGKMGIPDSILLKPGPLTDEEWEIMRKHPIYAHELLSPIAYLRPALHIPHSHHEKWDGTGYPGGLKGEQIRLEARIFAVVDVWDALTSDRPYRPAWPKEKAREHIREQAGKHFDPNVVTAFLEMDL